MKMSNDRGGFEKSWEKAFENAEMNPPSAVWDNIESKLDASGNKRKRIFLFVKLGVAASLVFALSLPLYNFLFDNNGIQNLTQQKNETKDRSENEIAGRGDINSNSNELIDSSNTSVDSEKGKADPENKSEVYVQSNSALAEKGGKGIIDDNDDKSGFSDTEDKGEFNQVTHEGNDRTELLTTNDKLENRYEMSFYDNSKSSGLNHLALNNKGLEEISTELGEIQEIIVYPQGYDLITSDKRSKNDKSDLFVAGLNFSTGLFDPGVSASTGTVNSDNAASFDSQNSTSSEYVYYAINVNSVNNSFTISESESYEQSVAYSYGANLGYKLSKRIVIYSGINYTKAYSNLNSNISITENGNKVANAIVTNRTANTSDLSSTGSSDVKVENAYEFASVPLKAGYLILDYKLNLTVLTGISTEFLLNSSYSSDDEVAGVQLASELESNKNDAYNTIYFNGILGLNIGYTFLENYRVSVEPSVRKSISSFLNNDNEVGRPLYKMVSFGISYQF